MKTLMPITMVLILMLACNAEETEGVREPGCDAVREHNLNTRDPMTEWHDLARIVRINADVDSDLHWAASIILLSNQRDRVFIDAVNTIRRICKL